MPDQKQKEFQILVDKFLNGTANAEEQETLDRYYLLFRDEPEYTSRLNQEQLQRLKERMENGLFDRIHQPAKTKRLWPRIAAAASILFILGIGGYFLLYNSNPKQNGNEFAKNNITPGSNQATLTLANGQKIILVKGLNGKLAQQGNTSVQVNAGQAITYSATSVASDQKIEYNTLSTKRHEQSPYPLVLADGTKVWLNAASSITFPTAFNGKDRVVTVTGEAYLEVVHNAAQPFRVQLKDQTIEDIGTKFNINAYPDEPETKTTLLEGSIKVFNDKTSKIIKPGQAAILKNGQTIIRTEEVDADDALAWKNGKFSFQQENITSIMRKLSRWYDVDVVYQDGFKDRSITSSISRFDNINKILNKITFTSGAHFKVEGRRITVTE